MVWRHRVFWLGLVSCAATIACGSPSERVAAPAAPTLVVLDYGAEPRRTVELAVPLHRPERIEQRVKTSVITAYTNTRLEDGRSTSEWPALRYVGRLEVTGRAPNGDALVTYELEHATVDEAVPDAAVRARVDAHVAMARGKRASWHLASTGRISDVTFETANRSERDRLAAIRNLIDDTSVEFPRVAIGPGARWQITTQHAANGIVWDRQMTFTLSSLDDRTATLVASTTMRAGSQALHVEPRVTTRLTSATHTGTADLIVPLTGVAITGTVHAMTELNFLVVRGRSRVASSLTITTEVSVTAP